MLIPIVDIVGGISYAVFNTWQENEEKRQALQASTDGPELMRIGILLREVE